MTVGWEKRARSDEGVAVIRLTLSPRAQAGVAYHMILVRMPERR